MRCASAGQSNHEIVKGESRNRQKGSKICTSYTPFLWRQTHRAQEGIGGGGATLGVSRMAAAEHRLRSAAPPQAAEPSSGGMAAHNRRLLDVWRFVRSDHLTPLPAVPAPVGKTSVPANVAAAARVYLDAHWQNGELVLVDAAGSKLKGGTLRGVASYMGTCQEQEQTNELHEVLRRKVNSDIGSLLEPMIAQANGIHIDCQSLIRHDVQTSSVAITLERLLSNAVTHVMGSALPLLERLGTKRLLLDSTLVFKLKASLSLFAATLRSGRESEAVVKVKLTPVIARHRVFHRRRHATRRLKSQAAVNSQLCSDEPRQFGQQVRKPSSPVAVDGRKVDMRKKTHAFQPAPTCNQEIAIYLLINWLISLFRKLTRVLSSL